MTVLSQHHPVYDGRNTGACFVFSAKPFRTKTHLRLEVAGRSLTLQAVGPRPGCDELVSGRLRIGLKLDPDAVIGTPGPQAELPAALTRYLADSNCKEERRIQSSGFWGLLRLRLSFHFSTWLKILLVHC